MAMENNKLEKMYFLLFAELFRKFLLLTSFCLFNSKKPGRQNSKSNHLAAPFISKIKIPAKTRFFKNCHLLPFAKLRQKYQGINPRYLKKLLLSDSTCTPMHRLQVRAIVCKLGFPCFFSVHLGAYNTLHGQFSSGKTMKVSTTKATGSETLL